MTRPPMCRHRRPGVWAPLVAAVVVAAGPWPHATATPAGPSPHPAPVIAAVPTAPRSFVGPILRMGQGISVTVPPGMLVFTQHCGTYGSSPAVPAAPGYPGYPRALPALPERHERVNNPATAPVPCEVRLDDAQVVRGGRLSGSTIADGRLSQITVLDTRSDDVGWTLTGSVADLRTGRGTPIDPDLLGWAPSVGRPASTPVYDHVVIAGPRVLPGQGLADHGGGLADASVLASAPAGHGLGFAAVDARLQLVAPPGTGSGPFTAVVNLTVV